MCIYVFILIYIYKGGLMEYISQKVAAYGQFVLVYILIDQACIIIFFCLSILPHPNKNIWGNKLLYLKFGQYVF